MSSDGTESTSSPIREKPATKSLMNNNNIPPSRNSTNKLDDLNYSSEVGTYSRDSNGCTNGLKCLLCSDDLVSISEMTFHLQSKHGIDKGKIKCDKNELTLQYLLANDIKNISRVGDVHNRKHEVSKNARSHKDMKLKTDSGCPDNKRTPQRSTTTIRDISDLRLHFEDQRASMKPSPSLSQNLFARLNQLSEPVARKLKFWNKKSFEVNSYDPCFKVIYLGNLGMQYWSKDENCLEKPLNTLWNNYLVNMKTEIVMRLTICNSGLKAITRQHGLTQYWSNRLVYCCSHRNYPKVFCWIYRHEGKKMRQELRCHAVFCSSPERATKMVTLLSQRLACALQEFKREKKSRGQPSSVDRQNSTITQQTLPRAIPLRRQILAKGSANFRPPLERSKSAPKLWSIREEDLEFEDENYSRDDLEEYEASGDETSHDELEYQQSFGEREDDDHDSVEIACDESNGEGDSAHKTDANSLVTTGNEETSDSSVYAIGGDVSYDNIVMNRRHLTNNQERLECASTLTAPAGTTTTLSSSSFRRSASSRRSIRHCHPPISILRQKNDDESPSLTNSIDVDLNHFESDCGDEDETIKRYDDSASATSHNLEQSAKAIINQESTSSLHNVSSVRVDGIQNHTPHSADSTSHQTSTWETTHTNQQNESDRGLAKYDAVSDEMGNTRKKVAVMENSPSDARSSTPSGQRQSWITDGKNNEDHEDSGTQDIILSFSNNLSIG